MKKYTRFVFTIVIISAALLSVIIIKNNSKSIEAVENNSEEISQNEFVPSSPSKDMCFIDPYNGWKASYEFQGMHTEDMTLYYTKDGGKCWTEIANTKDPNSTLPGAYKEGMIFINSTKGWIATNAPYEGRIGIYTTDDGGVTWSLESLKVPVKFSYAEIQALPPMFFSMSDGIILTFPYSEEKEQKILFYITHDGGKSWTMIEDKVSGASGKIKWHFTNSIPGTYKVKYNNSAWSFNGNTWVKD